MSGLLPVSAEDHSADPPPLAVDARRLAVMLSIGLRTLRTHDRAGKLPEPLRLGGRVLWRTEEIRAWLEAGAPNRDQWAAMRGRK